uniref:Uncharacterized protein n=1 Tax=Tanacetum cinerariifolium TaxID=118510 RepID=A0A6L2NL86_TANCI|nr:hypothetical protein [Tanacetum cinerariifolium]
MVTVLIHQASSLVLPLSTLIIDLSPPKPSRKRRRNNQDPPPPPPDLDPSKKRRHDSGASGQKSASHSEQPIKEAPMPDTTNIYDSDDTNFTHLIKIKTRPEWLKPISKEDRPETLKPDCLNQRTTGKSNLEGPAFKVAIAFHENNISLQFQMEECHQMLTNQVDLVNPEGYRLVPDVSKPLPLGGPPGQFKRKEFYITRHDAPSDRNKVRSHMRILSLISLKIYERYMYTFLKEIVLRRADYKEYKISDADFKNLHLNDFEDLYLLHLQDKFDQKKMMRETKVHKFSDGTLNRILDKLDHMVKDFKLFEYNPSMEIRIWSGDNKRRNKNFMEVNIKMEMVSPCSGRDKFITACSYLTDTFIEIMKVQAYVTKLPQL